MSHVEFVTHVCVGFVTPLTMEVLRRELPRQCAPIICSSYEFVTRSEFVTHSNQCAPIIRSPRASLHDVFNCEFVTHSHTHTQGALLKVSKSLCSNLRHSCRIHDSFISDFCHSFTHTQGAPLKGGSFQVIVFKFEALQVVE